jgi:hypothetical protein
MQQGQVWLGQASKTSEKHMFLRWIMTMDVCENIWALFNKNPHFNK